MDIFVIVIMLVGSAFFSAIEIAFISANKAKMSIHHQGRSQVVDWDALGQDPVRFITAMLVGNNLCLVMYGLFAGEFTLSIFQSYGIELRGISSFLVQVLVSAPIVIVVAEFLPKIFGYRYHTQLLLFLMPVAFRFYQVLEYLRINLFMSWLSGYVLHRSSVRDRKSVVQKEQLKDVFHSESGDTSSYFGMLMKMSENTLEFDRLRVGDCMIPAREVKAVEVDEHVDKLRLKFEETGRSRILIYDGTMENVLGYVHAFDMIKNIPKDIRAISLRKLPEYDESERAQEALKKLRTSNNNIALVLGAKGKTAGLVSIEDIIEKIVGEIEDEHDDTFQKDTTNQKRFR